jgi:transcriptional regulator with PAS, ATPase and Fis domain
MGAGSGDGAITEGLAETRLVVEQLQLRVVSGPDTGRIHAASGDRILVGKHQSNDLVLSDETVSRFHFEVVAEHGKFRLRDVGSRNGTLLDGISVLDAHLKPGMVITIGRTELRVDTGASMVSIPLSQHDSFGRMVGRSRAMRALFATLERAATTNATVLLMGETGTGKDIAAEMIHTTGPRSQQPFIVVDCGALPPNLMESELFGYEKGAFTGADKTRPGALEAANGGTLFFDEIGELPWDLQPKLLRVLESRQVQRIGSTQRIPFDVRVIAATSRNLWSEVNAQRFRSDLYYRLAVIKVVVPPLRERFQDLPLLIDTLLDAIGADEQEVKRLNTEEFRSEIGRHSWPGNVRELRNYLERCVALQSSAPPDEPGGDTSESLSEHSELPIAAARERWVRNFERRYAKALLLKHDNNVTAAARAAGIDRKSLHRLLSRCGIRAREDDEG